MHLSPNSSGCGAFTFTPSSDPFNAGFSISSSTILIMLRLLFACLRVRACRPFVNAPPVSGDLVPWKCSCGSTVSFIDVYPQHRTTQRVLPFLSTCPTIHSVTRSLISVSSSLTLLLLLTVLPGCHRCVSICSGVDCTSFSSLTSWSLDLSSSCASIFPFAAVVAFVGLFLLPYRSFSATSPSGAWCLLLTGSSSPSMAFHSSSTLEFLLLEGADVAWSIDKVFGRRSHRWAA